MCVASRVRKNTYTDLFSASVLLLCVMVVVMVVVVVVVVVVRLLFSPPPSIQKLFATRHSREQTNAAFLALRFVYNFLCK